MDMRKPVIIGDHENFLGQAEQTFYELLLPVSFKPKYASNPTGDKIFVTGAPGEAGRIDDLKRSCEEMPIKVQVTSKNELKVYDQSSSSINDEMLSCDIQAHDGTFTYTYFPDPGSMGDVFLKIINVDNSIPTRNSNGQEAIDFEPDKVEAGLFAFDDVLKRINPLRNKYGLVVDYAIKRKMLHKVN